MVQVVTPMSFKTKFWLFFVLQFCSYVGGFFGFNLSLMNETSLFLNGYASEKNPRFLNQLIANALVIQRLGRKSVCYGELGCFHVVGRFSHFRRVPDHPDRLATRFLLCTRRMPDCDDGTALRYEGVEPTPQLSDHGLLSSGLDLNLPVKVIIHGYSGHYNRPAVRKLKSAFLKKEDCNVVLVDWEVAARGPTYLRAVANAELIGRQVSKVLGAIVALGVSPRDIHIVGFSLGAQIAGFAGEGLKSHGIKLGRITGLDPASFMFERSNLDTTRKLDITDAELVDVVHTDGSLVWSDGFGILGAVGHVDFFPNGGQSQPGCSDSYVDALAFSIDPTSNTTRSCSHGRSLDLFLESMQSECKFVGFACPGLKDFDRHFVHGNCFSCDSGSCAVMGQVQGKVSPIDDGSFNEGLASSRGKGPLYLITRNTKPYCGQQVRALVSLSPRTLSTRGYLQLILFHGNTSTSFDLNSKKLKMVNKSTNLEIEPASKQDLPFYVSIFNHFRDWIGYTSSDNGRLYPLRTMENIYGGTAASSIVALKSGSLSYLKTPTLKVAILFKPSASLRRFRFQNVFFDRVTVTNQEGESWYFCGKDTLLQERNGSTYGEIVLELNENPC